MLLLDSYDERLLHALVLRRRRLLDHVMSVVTRLADPPVAIALGLALAAGVVPTLEAAGRIAFATLASSHLLVQIVKRSVVRTRPRLPVGLESMTGVPDRFSFPSGHAAAAFSLFVPLATALPLAGAVVVLLLALLVGLSRCYLGVHYPGDVLAGWALAAGSWLWLAEPLVGLF
jgi:undecaprenyl-diphosphatase